MASNYPSIPQEIRGMLPVMEHTIEPVDWVQDIAIVSEELDNDSFEILLNYFTNLKDAMM